MDHILYILPLSNSEAFKVGITKNTELSRIKILNNKYQFNLKESYIVKSDERIIKSLERQLLNDYSYYRYEVGDRTEGFTEFLKCDCLGNVLDDINYKKRLTHINFIITKGVKFRESKPKRKPNIKSSEKRNYEYDFSELKSFLSLVKLNSDRLSYSIETFTKDDITGERITIQVLDLELMKTLFECRGVKRKSVGSSLSASFLYGAEYSKVENMGFIRLVGIYTKFEHEMTYNDPIIYTEILNLYDELKRILPYIPIT